MDSEVKLPPLPEHQTQVWVLGRERNHPETASHRYYTVDQLREYARAAIALARPSAAGDAAAYRVTLHDGSTMLTPALHIAQAFEDSTFVPLYTAPPVAVSDAMCRRLKDALPLGCAGYLTLANCRQALEAALTGAQP